MSLGRFLFNGVAASAVVLVVALFTVGLLKTAVELIRDRRWNFFFGETRLA